VHALHPPRTLRAPVPDAEPPDRALRLAPPTGGWWVEGRSLLLDELGDATLDELVEAGYAESRNNDGVQYRPLD
jgi:hypothetical protein